MPIRFWYSFHMDIDLKDFSASQNTALFSLLILAMYADGHLTTVAEKHLQSLLTLLGHTEAVDRQREFDAAVNRMGPSVQSMDKAKNQALSLAAAFTLRSQQKRVYEAVEQIMTADRHVSSWESILLMELRMKFRL